MTGKFIALYNQLQKLEIYTQDPVFFADLDKIFAAYLNSAINDAKAVEFLGKFLGNYLTKNPASDYKAALEEIKNKITNLQDSSSNKQEKEEKKQTNVNFYGPKLPPQIDIQDLYVEPNSDATGRLLGKNYEIKNNQVKGKNGKSYLVVTINKKNYLLYRQLGAKGSTATTYLAWEISTDNFCAIKEFKNGQSEPTTEYQALAAHGESEGYVKCRDEYDNQHYYLHMQLASGQELVSVKNNTILSNSIIAQDPAELLLATASAIITAVEEDSNSNWLHVDLKGDNVLFDALSDPKKKKVKLIDRSHSIQLPKDAKTAASKYLHGCLAYLPPEYWKEYKQKKEHTYGGPAQVFGVGLMLAEWFGLARNEQRSVENYNDGNWFTVTRLCSKQDLKSYTTLPPLYLRAVYELLQDMTAENPNDRPTLEQAHQRLAHIQWCYTFLKAPFKKVAMVKISEFLNEDGSIKDQNIRKACNNTDEVYLIDDANYAEKDGQALNLAAILHQLREQKIPVRGILQVDTKKEDWKNEVASYLDSCKNPENDNAMNVYFHLTPKQPQEAKIQNPQKEEESLHKINSIHCTEKANPRQQIATALSQENLSASQYQFLIKKLFKELNRLEVLLKSAQKSFFSTQHEKDILNGRITTLKTEIKNFGDLYNKQKLSYVTLETKLGKLEKDMMQHTNRIQYEVYTFFKSNHTTTGSKFFKAMKEDKSLTTPEMDTRIPVSAIKAY